MKLESHVKIPVAIEGQYSIKTRNSVTGKVVTEKSFDCTNVVTNYGRHYYLRNTTYWKPNGWLGIRTAIGFSTGTSAVLATDTALSGTVIKKQDSPRSVAPIIDSVNRLCTTTVKTVAVFSPGELVGTFGQVGLFDDNPSNMNPYAGQQIKDGAGNPTTITFLAIEEVTVEYVIKVSFSYAKANATAADMALVGTTTVTGVDGTIHTVNMYGMPWWFGGNNPADSSQSEPTIFTQDAYYNTAYKATALIADTADAATWTKNELGLGQINTVSISNLLTGYTYKVSRNNNVIPYTVWGGKYIKYLRIGDMFYEFDYHALRRGNYVIDLEFNPPLLKPAGYELVMDVSMTYEFV